MLEKSLYLFNKPLLEHRIDSLLDALIKPLAIHGDAANSSLIVRSPLMQPLMVLGIAHAFIKHLERSDNTTNVVGMNQPSTARISILKKPIQPLWPKLDSKGLVL